MKIDFLQVSLPGGTTSDSAVQVVVEIRKGELSLRQEVNGEKKTIKNSALCLCRLVYKT